MAMLSNEDMNEKEDPMVIHTWANNKISNTVLMSIPHELAKKYGIKPHSNLLAIDTNDGILLKRIKIEMLD
jgi:hypothetical protein